MRPGVLAALSMSLYLVAVVLVVVGQTESSPALLTPLGVSFVASVLLFARFMRTARVGRWHGGKLGILWGADVFGVMLLWDRRGDPNPALIMVVPTLAIAVLTWVWLTARESTATRPSS